MRILWLNWRDKSHPRAGGAEIITEVLATRLARDGHQITLLVGRFPGAAPIVKKDGYTIVRVGGALSVYWHAYRYYEAHYADGFDLVIEEINTIPFFTRFYVRGQKILFIHQLAREIWWHEMLFPFSLIGYLAEPLYLRFLSSLPVVTVSASSKRDLERYGFKDISIISEGIDIQPLQSLAASKKFEKPTLLSLGALRSMKHTLDIVRTFEISKATLPDLELVVAGAPHGRYGDKVVAAIKKSPYATSIRFEGRVSHERKIELMQKSYVLAVTSVKEGWCLAVTEANSQGTPAAVYNVDGLRDSIQDNVTGLIAESNTPESLAKSIVSLLKDQTGYERLREAAWQWSKQITFENCYQDFRKVIQKYEN